MGIYGNAVDFGFPAEFLTEWARQHLFGEPTPDGLTHYAFRYSGQTCSWGRLQITSLMHALVRETAEGWVFERGWIDLPASDAGTHFMCEYQKSGMRMIAHLRETPEFTGQLLEQILAREVETNPQPCFCRKSMIDHKWRMMVATMLFAMQHHIGQDAA
jgi:hypothetical protein